MARRKVLIVDDDKEKIAAIRWHLEKDGYRVFATSSPLEAHDLIRRRRPDVLVVDQAWLEKDGLEPGRLMHAETPIILLTAETVDEERPFDTESEMWDRVAKPVDPCEVLARVRAALRRAGRDAPGGPEETRRGDLVIDRRCYEVRVRGETVHLTPTEFRLLEVMAGEPGRAFTRLELLVRVFGYDYQGLERTVDTHVKNLRSKIEPAPADPSYVKTVYGIGYKFAER